MFPWEVGKQAGAEVTSGQGLSHLAGTTFVKKLQVHWGLLQPLQPLGRQILHEGRQSACSQRLLLEGSPRGPHWGMTAYPNLALECLSDLPPIQPHARFHDPGLPWAWLRYREKPEEGPWWTGRDGHLLQGLQQLAQPGHLVLRRRAQSWKTCSAAGPLSSLCGKHPGSAPAPTLGC